MSTTVTFIVINYNTQETTLEALRRAQKSRSVQPSFIVIDNASREFDPEPFEKLGAFVIRNETNLGFAKAANQGLRLATSSDFAMLLNSDAFVEENAVSLLVDYAKKERRIGVIGPRMVYPDGRDQVSAGFFPTFTRALITYSTLYKYLPHSMFLFAANPFTRRYFRGPNDVDWISGGAMLIQKETLVDVGLLDEGYFFGGEDLDYCRRASSKGWRVVFSPLARVVHFHSYSSGGTRSTFSMKHQGEGMLRFMRTHFPGRLGARAVIAFVLKAKLKLIEKAILK